MGDLRGLGGNFEDELSMLGVTYWHCIELITHVVLLQEVLCANRIEKCELALQSFAQETEEFGFCISGFFRFSIFGFRISLLASVRAWSRYCLGDIPVACLNAMQKLFALW